MIRSSSASYALMRFSSRLGWLGLLAEESRWIGESDIWTITRDPNYALWERVPAPVRDTTKGSRTITSEAQKKDGARMRKETR